MKKSSGLRSALCRPEFLYVVPYGAPLKSVISVSIISMSVAAEYLLCGALVAQSTASGVAAWAVGEVTGPWSPMREAAQGKLQEVPGSSAFGTRFAWIHHLGRAGLNLPLGRCFCFLKRPVLRMLRPHTRTGAVGSRLVRISRLSPVFVPWMSAGS